MNNYSRDDIIKLDKKYIWHPYTQMKDYIENDDPLVISKAKGVFLFDKDGKKYYDGNSSWWVNNLGHSNPRLLEALKKQINLLPHCALAGITHDKAAILAEKICQVTPKGLEKVFYSDDGSTAVEVAVKMAFQYWQQNGKEKKTRFVSMKNAFHGETIGAVSVGGISSYHNLFSPILFESLFATSPYCYRCPSGKEKNSCSCECFYEMEKILRDSSSQIAAVIIEPMVQGAAGMLIYPEKYITKLRKITKELDIFLIADEVFVGFGRTGKMFACEYPDISPDFMCLSKGLTGGTLPFAITMTTNRLYSGFYDDYESQKTFYYGHSYCGNPLGSALGLEVLNIFKEEKIIDSLNLKIKTFHTMLNKFWDFDIVGDVRYLGLIGAIELVKEKKTKTPFPSKLRLGNLFYKEALTLGAYLRPLGDIIYMVLPLTITQEEIKELTEIAFESLKKVSGKI